jgi:hypothetical protein
VSDSKASKTVNGSKARKPAGSLKKSKPASDFKAGKPKPADEAVATQSARAQKTVALDAGSLRDAGLSYEQVRVRAYELYVSRGGEHGQDQDDWFRAELEILDR